MKTTNSPGLSCLYEAQKKIKSSTFKTKAKSKYNTKATTITMLILLLLIITYIFFIFLFFFYPQIQTSNTIIMCTLSCMMMEWCLPVLISHDHWHKCVHCSFIVCRKKNRFINKEFTNDVFTVLSQESYICKNLIEKQDIIREQIKTQYELKGSDKIWISSHWVCKIHLLRQMVPKLRSPDSRDSTTFRFQSWLWKNQ